MSNDEESNPRRTAMSEIDEFVPNAWKKSPLVVTAQRMRAPFTIQSPTGPLHGKAGDWVITGVTGEEYPCPDDVFRKTYTLASEKVVMPGDGRPIVPICTCPAMSEYDPPCAVHGIRGIGVTPSNDDREREPLHRQRAWTTNDPAVQRSAPVLPPIEARLWIDGVLSSSHRLPFVGAEHRCHSMHGHDFRVRLHASGYVTPAIPGKVMTSSSAQQIGMVVDYDRLVTIWKQIQENLDHKNLNQVIDNPTCENIAIWILQNTPRWICAVEISTMMKDGAAAGCTVPRSRERGDGYPGYNVPATIVERLPAEEVL